MISNLTAKRMLAARMLVEDHPDCNIIKECGVSRDTLKQWMEEPDFQAYQEAVRSEHDCFLRSATQIERKKHKITLAGIVAELQKLVDLPVATEKITVSDKIKLYTTLIDLLQLRPAPGATGEGAAEPDVYRAAWMPTETPQ